MDGHSLYFIGYAVFATVAGIVIAHAQYSRKKREGKKINFTLLKVVFGFALLMWTGAALAAVYYTSSTTATAIAGIFGGIILSLFFGWQINIVIRKIQADETYIERLATHDALTGLWNRRVFHQTLKKEIAYSHTQGTPLCLLMLDIDNLSDINAQYGYEPGDLVLRELARLVKKGKLEGTLICRYRSKELALILPGLDVEKAREYTEALQAQIKDHAFDAGDGIKVSLTVTAGIAPYDERTPTEPSLVEAGENAMFKAAKRGAHSLLLA